MPYRRLLIVVLAVVIGIAVFGDIAVSGDNAPVLKIGHVGHDHHTALYVAALNGDLFKREYGIYLKEIRAKKLYELYDGDSLVCELELYKAGGGSKMPTDMAQGIFDVGFGGAAAVMFFIDKGTPMRIISPLHSKGDMLVAGADVPSTNWADFVALCKARREPLKVGFKKPKAIALLIFEGALREEGISYTYDVRDREAKVLLVNMKGAGHLNPGLENGIIDAFVCNNPYCAIAEEKGIGRCIADLNDLPPGLWKDHPCCVIAAMEKVIEARRAELIKFLELIVIATDYINADQDIAVRSASKWIGTSIAVEEKSIPTSKYLTEPDQVWLNGIYTWVHSMDDLGHIKGQLHGRTNSEINASLLDLSLIKEARAKVAERRGGK
ncbi:MAG TPA: ABC transporter substrate-binding protein [Bacteroidetes bacterium]|nr:ABC transporter substrate-binding protein [Bacteroidota bacterium]